MQLVQIFNIIIGVVLISDPWSPQTFAGDFAGLRIAPIVKYRYRLLKG